MVKVMVQFKDHEIIGLESPSYLSLRKKRLSYLGYFYRSLSNHLKKIKWGWFYCLPEAPTWVHYLPFLHTLLTLTQCRLLSILPKCPVNNLTYIPICLYVNTSHENVFALLLFPRTHFSEAVIKTLQNATDKASIEVLPSFPLYKHYFNPSFRTVSSLPPIPLWRWNDPLAICRSFNPSGLP